MPPLGRPAFPLRIESGKGYLVDSTGQPFLIHGDTAWSLIAQLEREDVDRYLDDRRARGFNALLVNLIERKFATAAPANAYGVLPFRTADDFGTPDDRYFAHADWVIRRAADRGFLVLLTPSYLGHEGGPEGWYQAMRASGPSRLREYGRYLGRRYASFDNIVWVHGGDYNPPDKRLVREIAEGIREFDRNALHSAHCAPEARAVSCWAGESWLQIDTVYTYGPAVFAAHPKTERIPSVFIEGRYENELDGTEQRVRVQAYQALLSGAAGHVFGNNPVWHFDGPGLFPAPTSWQEALGSRGTQSMAHLRTLFAARRWWTLEHDRGNATLTAGHGSIHERAVAALATDRAFAIVYMPTTRTLIISMDRLAGPLVTARWYDPSDGSYLPIPGSPFPVHGRRSFQPPGRNSSGFGDWVLALESGP